MKSNENLTIEQKNAIDFKSGNLIVSASAGSGKTFVVIERMIKLITQDGASVDKILALTFTNLAAAEMKSRLKEALYEEFNQTGDIRLKKEIDKISVADVSTIHSFCLNLLKKYFYVIGLDASFFMLDEKQANNLKSQAVEDLFEELYEQKNARFLTLADMFSSSRDDKALKKLVIETHTFSESEKSIDDLKEKTKNSYLSSITQLKQRILSDFQNILQSGYSFYEKFIIEQALQQENSEFVTKAQEIFEKIKILIKLKSEQEIFESYKNNPFKKIAKTNLKNLAQKEFKEFTNNFIKQIEAVCKSFNEYFVEQTNQEEIVQSGLNTALDLLWLTDEFNKKYEELKNLENGVDFHDLEKLTYKLLSNEQNAIIREEIKNKYDYIFIDEYQDVNYVQEEILNLISSNNLFMVGDAKQSIYGFRGCNPKFFVDKFIDFSQSKGGTAHSLNTTFRSAPNVVKAVNNVFSRVMTSDFGGIDYLNESQMQYGGLYGDYTGKAVIHFVEVENDDVEEQQFSGVYSVVKDSERVKIQNCGAQETAVLKIINDVLGTPYFDVKSKTYKEVGFADVCILLRGFGEFSESLAKLLISHDVPISFSGDCLISGYPEIKALVNAVKTLISSRGDIPLASTMLNFGNFNEEELCDIRNSNKDIVCFADCVYEYAKSDGRLKEKVNNYLNWINGLRLFAEYADAGQTLNRLIRESGYDVRLLSSRGGEGKLARVERFIAEAYVGGKEMTVYEFDRYLDDSLDKITIKESAGEETVKIMTEHSSKGLEFPILIFAAAQKKFNFKNLQGKVIFSRKYGIATKTYNTNTRTVCENALREIVKIEGRKNTAIEEARLFYVALTRAKCELHIITTEELNTRTQEQLLKADSPLCFLSQLDMDYDIITADSLAEYYLKEQTEETRVVGKEKYKELTRELVKNLSFKYKYALDTTLPVKSSVSELAHYDDEYFETINRSFKGESSAEKGTAYHRFMELSCFDCNSVQNELSLFEEKGLLTKQQVNLLDANKLTSILKMPVFEELKGKKLYKEQKFCHLISAKELGYDSSEEILIQGVADLIVEENDGSLTLIDYKLSTIVEDCDLVKTYFEQMRLYKNAIQCLFNKNVNKVLLINVLQEKIVEVNV